MHDNTIRNEVLQRYLDNIKEFNVDKCKVMHLERLNQSQGYTIGGGGPLSYNGGKELRDTC